MQKKRTDPDKEGDASDKPNSTEGRETSNGEVNSLAEEKAAQVNRILVSDFIPGSLKELLEQLKKYIEEEQPDEGSLRTEARRRLKQGIVLLEAASREDDFEEAVRILKKGIESDPTLIPLQFCLAIALEKTDSYEEAYKTYSRISRLAGSSEPKLAALSLARMSFMQQKTGNFPEAIEDLQAAVEKDPENLEICFALARILSLTGLGEEAAGRMTELIRKDRSFIKRIQFDHGFPDAVLQRVINLLKS